MNPWDEMQARIKELEAKVAELRGEVNALLHAQQRTALFLAEHGWGFSCDD